MGTAPAVLTCEKSGFFWGGVGELPAIRTSFFRLLPDLASLLQENRGNCDALHREADYPEPLDPDSVRRGALLQFPITMGKMLLLLIYDGFDRIDGLRQH